MANAITNITSEPLTELVKQTYTDFYNPDFSAQKFDQEKPRMDLLDPDWLEGVAKVLTFGAEKYSPNQWRKGIQISRLIAAAYRHLGAVNRGEDIDPESGELHLYHASCCLMFASWMLQHRPELDDRYKKDNNGSN